MSFFRNFSPENKTFWLVLLLAGLVLESCVVGGLALIWWNAQGEELAQTRPTITSTPETDQPPTDIDGVIPTLSAPTFAPGTTPEPTEPGVIPLPTDTLLPTFTPGAPTETFQLPQFDTPPEGKIAFTCFDGDFDQICIMNADGSNIRQLTDDEATNFYPSLSPDGEQIVFSSRLDGNFEIHLMNVDGTNRRQLTDDIGNLFAPEISPNGQRIVFTGASGTYQAIWIMRIDGANARPLTTGGTDVDPTWSPEGERILFASAREGATTLFIMNANGTNARRVMERDTDVGGRSSWSPDGQWIAFYAGERGDRNVYIVGVNGRNVARLTNGGDNLAPSFSPEGDWIAFTSFRDGNNEIYVMRPDGSEETRLTSNRRSEWQPRWGR